MAPARHRTSRQTGPTGSARSAGALVKRLELAGFVVYGLVHLVIGILAIQLAVGAGAEDASTSGALAALADQPLGSLVVWLVAAGMGLLAAWQLVEAAGGIDSDEWSERVKAAARGIAYGAVSVTALRVALGAGSGGEAGTAESAAVTLLTVPGGRLLVAVVGVMIVALGVADIVKAATAGFLEDVDRASLTGRTRPLVVGAGRAGFAARGVAYGVVGLLFLAAAWRGSGQEAGGLDQSLAFIRDQPLGQLLLVAVGAGFALFAGYCLAVASRARRR